MTKSTSPTAPAATTVREVRPFLFLDPAPATPLSIEPAVRARLDRIASEQIPQLVRSLVDYTIALQNRRALERGNPQPIQLSVLNRRRRAARAWLVAILAGATDTATLQAVTGQWLPTLCAAGLVPTGVQRAGRRLVEFVRGALTACVFDEAADNLLPHAKAEHVIEATLQAHLAALLRATAAVVD